MNTPTPNPQPQAPVPCVWVRAGEGKLRCERCGTVVTTHVGPNSLSRACKVGLKPGEARPKIQKPDAAEVMQAMVDKLIRQHEVCENLPKALEIRRRWTICNGCTPAFSLCPLVVDRSLAERLTPCQGRTEWVRYLNFGGCGKWEESGQPPAVSGPEEQPRIDTD